MHRKIIALFQFKFSPPPQAISIENARGAQSPQFIRVSPLLADDSCPHRAIHSQSRALTFAVNAEANAFRKMPGAILCIPEITSPFSTCFLSPGFAGLPGKHSGILRAHVPVRTGKCSSSTLMQRKGQRTSRSREGNAGVLLLCFIPHVKT